MMSESPVWGESPGSYLASAMLELRMEQAAILLNREFAKSTDPSLPTGQSALLQAAIPPIDTHYDLFRTGNVLFNLFGSDIVTAVLTIAYCFIKNRSNGRKSIRATKLLECI